MDPSPGVISLAAAMHVQAKTRSKMSEFIIVCVVVVGAVSILGLYYVRYGFVL
jgi:hypothetical protein